MLVSIQILFKLESVFLIDKNVWSQRKNVFMSDYLSSGGLIPILDVMLTTQSDQVYALGPNINASLGLGYNSQVRYQGYMGSTDSRLED